MHSVGERMRVSTGPGKSCRGLILCVGSTEEGNPTYDVLLQSPDPTSTAIATASSPSSITADARKEEDATERELTGLSASSLSTLQPFELDQSTEDIQAVAEAEVVFAAERLKDGGNTLFKLGDTDAAAEMFARVLRTLERAPVVGKSRAGRKGVVPNGATSTCYRSGMVSDANEDDGPCPTYDVIYDETAVKSAAGGNEEQQEGEEEDDEEDGVSPDRVLGVPLSPCVWCAARLNLARCSFRRRRHEEVVEACTLVLSLARLTMGQKKRPREERAKLRAHCLTALRMRGGSHLAQHHVGQARKDARSMVRSSGDDEESRAQATRFEAEVERKAKALLKTNRKLAKDVTRWVDASMAKHEEACLKTGDEALPPPPAPRSGEERGDGGVEESKGGRRSAGDGGDGGAKSWLGSWMR
ncbi:unnamed protein product [Ectocarpus sp. 6 AP-2014]